MELEGDIMVLSNVTKFHKILIKTIRFRELTSLGQYVRWDGRTGVTLNAPAIENGGGMKIVTFKGGHLMW